MPGLPSVRPLMASPTGCTKQLIRVAWSSVPAAELIRPPGIKPASMASKKRRSHIRRVFPYSLAAKARATRWRTSVTFFSFPLAYFSKRTSVEIPCSSSS